MICVACDTRKQTIYVGDGIAYCRDCLLNKGIRTNDDHDDRHSNYCDECGDEIAEICSSCADHKECDNCGLCSHDTHLAIRCSSCLNICEDCDVPLDEHSCPGKPDALVATDDGTVQFNDMEIQWQ